MRPLRELKLLLLDFGWPPWPHYSAFAATTASPPSHQNSRQPGHRGFWFWHTDRLPYFHFCHSCHESVWRHDSRPRRANRYTTKPGLSSFAQALSDGARRVDLVAGSLYLLEEPPELVDPRVQQQLLARQTSSAPPPRPPGPALRA